jgi:hypothetical protein
VAWRRSTPLPGHDPGDRGNDESYGCGGKRTPSGPACGTLGSGAVLHVFLS